MWNVTFSKCICVHMMACGYGTGKVDSKKSFVTYWEFHGDMNVYFILQNLYGLAIELVFPVFGMFRLRDERVSHNREVLEELRNGTAFEKANGDIGRYFLSGSSAEGLALEDSFGHTPCDDSVMVLLGGDLGVYVPEPGQSPAGESLCYDPTGCPPAYTRLRVLDPSRLHQGIMQWKIHIDSEYNDYVPMAVASPEKAEWIVNDSDNLWVDTRHMLESISHPHCEGRPHGPAGQLLDDVVEYVPALVGSAPHPSIEAYCNRRRRWPTQAILEEIRAAPMLSVLKGRKSSVNSHLQWRASWSHGEFILIHSLETWIKQAFIAFKYAIKSVMSKYLDSKKIISGRPSPLKSYHLKTVFLHHLENRPPKPSGSSFQFMCALCYDLKQRLEARTLPHYFVSDCNLLDGLKDEDRQFALRAVSQLLREPLSAIILSPTAPWELYGGTKPSKIIKVFNDLISNVSCKESQEPMRRLLHDLDVQREICHRRQLRRDQYELVSGRPEMKRLTECFERINVI